MLPKILFIVVITLTELTIWTTAQQEQFRPQLRYSVPKNWLNDPNGLVYLSGEYHMYYQYHPGSSLPDLIHWTDLPDAIEPDSEGDIWSGNAVVDFKNSSGFQVSEITPPIIALYTHAGPNGQQQYIAYSNDNGRTFTTYSGNPVVPNPGKPDFRDPNVILYNDVWIMLFSAGDRIVFYSSTDLKEWEFISDFGVEPDQGLKGVWECPDMYPLMFESELVWILQISNGGGGPNGGSNTQYFVGSFNGTHYSSSQVDPLWLDWGIDNYAAISFYNEARSRRVSIGWMTNLMYANDLPTGDWRGQMGLPRELKLAANSQGEPRLQSSFVSEFDRLIDEEQEFLFGEIDIAADDVYNLTDLVSWNNPLMKLSLDLDVGDLCDGCSVAICFLNGLNEDVCTGFDQGRERPIFLDRERSGQTDFNPNFRRRMSAERELGLDWDPNIFRVAAVLDVVAIEVFFDDGMTGMNCLFYPTEPYTRVEIRHHALGSNPTSKLAIRPNAKFQGLKSIFD